MSVVPLVSPYRNQVIRLYRQILKLGRHWESVTKKPEDTVTEREYIITEAKTLFRRNQHLTDPKVISDFVQEAQARLELATHYKTPYPRPVNVPPNALARRKGREQGAVQERIKKQSMPIYIKSKVD